MTLVIFKICAIACFAAFVLSALFLFDGVQERMIAFGQKLAGRTLDAEHWHKIIKMRTKFFMFFSLAIGAAFVLMSLLKFEPQSDFKLNFALDKTLSSDKRFLIPAACVFILLSILQFYWLAQKKTYHIDELYEIGIVNRNEYGFWNGDLFYSHKDFDSAVPYTGKEIKEKAFFDDGSIKDALSDSFHLYFNCNDGAHTGTYYILQRLAFLGAKTCNQAQIFLRSFALNYLLFALCFYFALLLFYKLTSSKFLTLVLLAAAFANPNAIGNVLFFRPFILQELGMLVFACVFVFHNQAIEAGMPISTKRNFVISSACVGLALVSEYFSLFFVAFLGLAAILQCVRFKRQKDIIYFADIFFAGIIAAKLLYLDYGLGFFDERTPTSLMQSLVTGIKTSVVMLDKYFIAAPIFAALLAANCALALAQKNKRHSSAQIVAGAALLWILACNFFAPFKFEPRYTAPAFVYLPLVLIPFFDAATKTKKSALACVQIVATILIASKSLPLASNAQSIPHLDDAHKTHSSVQYNKTPDIPVVFFCPTNYTAIFPYLNDKQTYYFVDSIEDIEKIEGLNEYWRVTYYDRSKRIDERLRRKQ